MSMSFLCVHRELLEIRPTVSLTPAFSLNIKLKYSCFIYIFKTGLTYFYLISGQVKKRKIDEDIAVENEIEPEKKIKMEPEQESKTIEPEKEKKDAIKCENCGIVFSKMAAYSAHAEFYCQKRLKKE